MMRTLFQISWMALGIGTSVLAVEDKSSSGLVQIVTFLCGLLSVLFSIMCAGLLKHLSDHSKFREDVTKALEGYRQVKDCVLVHGDHETLTALVDEMQKLREALGHAETGQTDSR